MGVFVVDVLGYRLGTPLRPTRIDTGDGIIVEVDAASHDNMVLVEVSPNLGPLRGNQTRKLIADAFKLIWVGARLNSARLLLAVTTIEAYEYLRRPNSWLSAALTDGRVEVVYIRPD